MLDIQHGTRSVHDDARRVEAAEAAASSVSRQELAPGFCQTNSAICRQLSSCGLIISILTPGNGRPKTGATREPKCSASFIRCFALCLRRAILQREVDFPFGGKVDFFLGCFPHHKIIREPMCRAFF